MIQIRSVFPEETWPEYFANHVICQFWKVFNTQQYNLFFTRRELHRTCNQMQKVLENSDHFASTTYLEIEKLEQRYESIVQHIRFQIEELAREERIITQQRRDRPTYTPSHLFKKLTVGDQQLVNEARLLKERISSLQDHVEKIEALKRDMYVHFERCTKQYNSVQLSMHIADIKKTVSDLRLEALKPLSDQLRKDVDSIKEKMNEMGRKMAMHDKIENRAFARFGHNATSVETVSDVMTEILSSSSMVQKVEAVEASLL